ncbi:hypothetical protein SERLADRAFT_407586 [Serpula lacrymans var. lacrymans S7.9]|uniref:Fungal-type protein kinase domain-containing protein n=1 Tax=Serpula lacrymans var. lacrymans (strain S7.9) TaxID=578457 RepID=F8NSS6_SERL9|nr:uncharacterized protein SERLADRAFT_407586 [Serpula lacrymans var. lacrymans S7.9]EGO27000.1 hypothetical protein SERLADRAFT_407586 [Serpula lacrymans var. lacrymans S7.9]
MLIEDDGEEETTGDVLQELQKDLFSFVPIQPPDIIEDKQNIAGPSLHPNLIILDDDEDECIEVEHPTAGKVISMDETLHQRWRREFFRAGGGGDRGEDVEMGEDPDPKFFPFASEMDWRVACWEIKDGVKEKLGLSYHNICALHKIVDHNIPARAEWKSTMISFRDTPDDTHLIQYRDVLSAIRTLLGNPAHVENIVYRPKKVFTDASRGYTMRCGQGSDGYLSVNKVKGFQLTAKAKSSRVQRLFHESMRVILEPLKKAGIERMDITGGDGAVRRVHPVLACYVADYPEQCLVTCTKYGTCPKCKRPASELSESTSGEPHTQNWTEEVIQNARANTDSFYQFQERCKDNNVSGGVYEPFWLNFPHCNIHLSVSPDILHQLYQGVFKHMVNWCKDLMDPKELD